MLLYLYKIFQINHELRRYRHIKYGINKDFMLFNKMYFLSIL